MRIRPVPPSDGVELSNAELARSLRRRFRLLAGGVLALTLGLSVAPVAASHLVVRTSDIVNGAVTTSKLRNGAVNTAKLARNTQGVALAGAHFNAFQSGTIVFSWFNRFGGAPIVTRLGTGRYRVAFPGLEGKLGLDAIVVAMPSLGAAFSVRQMDSGGDDVVALRAVDARGFPADGEVNLVVMAPNSAGATGTQPGGQREARVSAAD
jgi:hypothetical protein